MGTEMAEAGRGRLLGDEPGEGQVLMSVREVDFSYGERPTLRKVSAELKAGRLMGLLGPNGSGKSTLFKCCLGFLKIQGGSIEIGGRPLASLGARRLAERLAYVPQDHKPAFPYTVREMVSMGRTPRMGRRPIMTALDRQAVERAMESAGVAALAEQSYNRLSGGQRQLALVARALAQEASLILLDEPTASLDFQNQIRIWRVVRQVVESGRGAMICCHDPNHILWFCDEATVLSEGRVLAAGPAREAVTAEVLESLYGREVKKATTEGKPFVSPRSLDQLSWSEAAGPAGTEPAAAGAAGSGFFRPT
jgi:iron complex transport system ATP-binding protein